MYVPLHSSLLVLTVTYSRVQLADIKLLSQVNFKAVEIKRTIFDLQGVLACIAEISSMNLQKGNVDSSD